MKTIYKYQVTPTDPRLEIELPGSAKVVFVGSQLVGVVNFWVELTISHRTKHKRIFVLHGTGHDIPDNHDYIGSVLDSPFVWHLYEENSVHP